MARKKSEEKNMDEYLNNFPEEPESVTECLYYSNRKFTIEKGRALAWAFRKKCPSCGKGLMKKPKKTAKEYVCPECGYSEPAKEHEADVVIYIKYVCPFCGFEGKAVTEYKRKSWYGEKAYVFKCGSCGEKLGLTKKLKTPKRFLEKLGVDE